MTIERHFNPTETVGKIVEVETVDPNSTLSDALSEMAQREPQSRGQEPLERPLAKPTLPLISGDDEYPTYVIRGWDDEYPEYLEF